MPHLNEWLTHREGLDMHLASSDGLVPRLISEEVQRKDSKAYCNKYEVERPADSVLRCSQETHGVDMLLIKILSMH